MPLRYGHAFGSIGRKSTASSAGTSVGTRSSILSTTTFDPAAARCSRSSEPGIEHYLVASQKKDGSHSSAVSFLRSRKKQDSRYEKSKKRILCGAALILLAITSCFAVFCYFLFLHISKDDVCLTDTCVKLGGSMRAKMNRSVDLCSDFYEFACGTYARETPLPIGFPSYSPIQHLGHQVYRVLRDEIEKNYQSQKPNMGYKSSAQVKAATLYRSCREGRLIKHLGIGPLKELVSSIGGWGVSEGTPLQHYRDWDLQKAIENLFDLSVFPFFSITTERDARNQSQYIISIGQPHLILQHRSLYTNPQHVKLLEIYHRFIVTMAERLGEKRTELKEQAAGILGLESELARIMDPEEIRMNSSAIYSSETLHSMNRQFNQIDWIRLTKFVYRDTGAFINANTPVAAMGIGYLERLSILLSNYTADEKGRRILDDYMRWRAIYNFIPFVKLDFEDPSFNLLMMDEPDHEPGWIRCLKLAVRIAPKPLTALFLHRNRDHEKNKQEVSSLTENLINTLKQEISDSNWMDDQTKSAALLKVNGVVPLVGYSEEILDWRTIDKEHESLNIQPRKYFWNVIEGMKFYRAKQRARLSTSPDRTKWDYDSLIPLNSNAYYDYTTNKIVIPMGILAPHIYSLHGPEYANYGAIGSIIGHELSHGFDDTGRKYDSLGEIQLWMSQAVLDEYTHRTECLKEQYSGMNYTGPDGITIKVNGKRTLNENFSDNGGLKLAYLAYKRHSQGSLPLPGLRLTGDQTFFLSFAQNWCSVASPDYLRDRGQHQSYASYPVERFRVIGTLQNMKEFSEAYSCPVNSPMNPSEKCSSLW